MLHKRVKSNLILNNYIDILKQLITNIYSTINGADLVGTSKKSNYLGFFLATH